MAPKTRLKKIRKLENKKIRKLAFAFALWRLNLDYSEFVRPHFHGKLNWEQNEVTKLLIHCLI